MPWRFQVLSGRGPAILSQPSLLDAMPGAVLSTGGEFTADGVHVDAKDGRAYLHLQDGRGWVCERLRTDFRRFAVEPLHELDEDSNATRRKATEGNANVVVVERKVSNTAKAAPAKPTRCLSSKQEPVVFRSDSDLWPNPLGSPRPINMEMRRALRRLAKYYGCKLQECKVDLQEVEKRIEAFATACPGRKLLETHADTLRKERDSVEKKWTALVQKEIGNSPVCSAAVPSPCSANARIAPVQVLGELWHCATLLVEEDSGDDWCLGPLRAEARLAAEDLQLMKNRTVFGKTKRGKRKNGDGEGGPAAKKQQVARDAD